MTTILDKLWLWAHEAGSYNGAWKLPKPSRITAAEAAFYMGIPNLVQVRYLDKPAPPYDQYAVALRPLKRVVWSIVGAGGCKDNTDEVSRVTDLAGRFPNITGVIMDDFFVREIDATGHTGTGYTPQQLNDIQRRLRLPERKLDLWVVLYDRELHLPVQDHLKQCDVVTFWTWESVNLSRLEENFAKVEQYAPNCRKLMGCYMYDFGAQKPMPVAELERQCSIGLRWIREGRIEGMLFVSSSICDLDLEAVEWTRQWIQSVGGEKI